MSSAVEKLGHIHGNKEEPTRKTLFFQEAEQRRQSKMGRSNKKPHQQQNKDVVGNAKGQGQDKQVLINRARKNANKNKNHRNQADKKQSKGMF